MFDGFGERDPRKMPSHLFFDALHIDYATAVRADIDNQNYSVCPRHWYVDATFCCKRCNENFIFTADEQRFWYEELRFWIDSQATHCRQCRSDVRRLKSLRQAYDRDVEQILPRDVPSDHKQRLLKVIEELAAHGVQLPERMQEKRQVLVKQLQRDAA